MTLNALTIDYPTMPLLDYPTMPLTTWYDKIITIISYLWFYSDLLFQIRNRYSLHQNIAHKHKQHVTRIYINQLTKNNNFFNKIRNIITFAASAATALATAYGVSEGHVTSKHQSHRII